MSYILKRNHDLPPEKRLPIIFVVPEGKEIPNGIDINDFKDNGSQAATRRGNIFQKYGEDIGLKGYGQTHLGDANGRYDSDIQSIKQFTELLEQNIGNVSFGNKKPIILQNKVHSFFFNVYRVWADGKNDDELNDKPKFTYKLHGDERSSPTQILINNYDSGNKLHGIYQEFYTELRTLISKVKQEYGFCLVFLLDCDFVRGYDEYNNPIDHNGSVNLTIHPNYDGKFKKVVKQFRDSLFTALKRHSKAITVNILLDDSARYLPLRDYHNMRRPKDNVFVMQLGISYDIFHKRELFTRFIEDFSDQLTMLEEISHTKYANTINSRISGRVIFGDLTSQGRLSHNKKANWSGKQICDDKSSDFVPAIKKEVELCRLVKKSWHGFNTLIAFSSTFDIVPVPDSEHSIKTKTNEQGRFQFDNVPPCSVYVVRVKHNDKFYTHIDDVGSFHTHFSIQNRTFNRGGNLDYFKELNIKSLALKNLYLGGPEGYPPVPIFIGSHHKLGPRLNEPSTVIDIHGVKDTEEKKEQEKKKNKKNHEYSYVWAKFKDKDSFDFFKEKGASAYRLNSTHKGYGDVLSSLKRKKGEEEFENSLVGVPVYLPKVLALGACLKGKEREDEWKWDKWEKESEPELKWEPKIINVDGKELVGVVKGYYNE